jgi:Tfp pilus assembly PilM family ATPase
MKWPFSVGTSGLIGVELSARWMKAYQSQGRGRAACTRVERRRADAPFSSDDARILAGVLERAGFSGRRVVLVPPRDHVIMDVLELPPRSSGAPLGQLAAIELARTHRCDPASFEVGWWEVPTTGRPGEHSQVFAAAMTLAKSEPLMEACAQAGLRVEAIDVPINALARSYGVIAPDAMLDIGWTGGMLCVMHGGVVVYERTIEEAGLRRLVEPLSVKLGVPVEAAEQLLLTGASGDSVAEHPLASEWRGPLNEYLETVTNEVQRSLVYMAHRHAQWHLRAIGLSGDGACLAGVREKIGGGLGVEIVEPEGIGAPFAMASGAGAFGAKVGRGAA